MISYDDLVSGHTLSFHQQPYLRELFASVRNTTKLTIVVGAGVSMNAGLLSWKELIGNMVEQIKDDRLREMARQDQSDLMRKAELVTQLIKKHTPKKHTAQVIRQALYPKGSGTRGGEQLATSIARLVAARKSWKDVNLLTTNFDTELERALSHYFDADEIKAFSLKYDEQWANWRDANHVGVMHVHGVVQRRGEGPSKGPIVLTESQFFAYGAKVRKVISECLREACTLFVGLSMSDPNLVGPLYERAHDGSASRFALTVPEKVPGANDSQEAARYALESARFMKARFDLNTIFLKSYSQLNQVLSDLSLALTEPQRYQIRGRRREARSLVYGTRIVQALNNTYANLGCNGRHVQIPLGLAATELNERLHQALHARGGPIALLRKFALTHPGSHDIGRPDGENFALYLWLRCRRQVHGNASYALNLVGTSAYIHRERWAIRHEEAITRDSKMAAVRAVFYGLPLAINADPSPNSPHWKGIVACPVVVDSVGSDLRINGNPVDILTIGAITLNSTRIVDEKDPKGESGENEEPSIIAKLDPQQMAQVFERILQTAAKVLGL